jgi:anti-sigma B factor antagonist
MAFTITETITAHSATFTLTGELDASSAPAFREQIEAAAAARVTQVVLNLSDLEYMSSAGLRVLIYAKQKMGVGVEIILVGTQPMVQDTLEKTGFNRSVRMVASAEGLETSGANSSGS